MTTATTPTHKTRTELELDKAKREKRRMTMKAILDDSTSEPARYVKNYDVGHGAE